jgi:hypothetical protein
MGGVVVAVLIVVFAFTSASNQDDSLAGQMERWTTCLRSEGAPVPLVETVGDEGFRITFDESVLVGDFNFDTLSVAFDLCLEDAPDGVQTVADTIDALTSLPFGGGDFGWLGPLLFDLGDSGLFDLGGLGLSDDPEMSGPPGGDPPLDELCTYLSDLGVLPPDVAADLLELCASVPNV